MSKSHDDYWIVPAIIIGLALILLLVVLFNLY